MLYNRSSQDSIWLVKTVEYLVCCFSCISCVLVTMAPPSSRSGECFFFSPLGNAGGWGCCVSMIGVLTLGRTDGFAFFFLSSRRNVRLESVARDFCECCP